MESSRRLALFAGAAAIAGVATVAILSSVLRPSNPGATPPVSTPVDAIVDACTSNVLEATVGGWEGAAGHRIGRLTVTNAGVSACTLPGGPQPSLVDRNGKDLIVGKYESRPVYRFEPGATVQSLVQTGNYCGPEAQEPATIVLDLGEGGRVIAKPVAGDDSSGVPPCMGVNGPTNDITIQPWGAAQG